MPQFQWPCRFVHTAASRFALCSQASEQLFTERSWTNAVVMPMMPKYGTLGIAKRSHNDLTAEWLDITMRNKDTLLRSHEARSVERQCFESHTGLAGPQLKPQSETCFAAEASRRGCQLTHTVRLLPRHPLYGVEALLKLLDSVWRGLGWERPWHCRRQAKIESKEV